mmetsp:Transcript_112063/g.327773  ORF Transcript_112063/g.327773 Transcript_112063/m.327773 type:complete len:88 (+) Transcript_112063:1556-1819(+)
MLCDGGEVADSSSFSSGAGKTFEIDAARASWRQLLRPFVGLRDREEHRPEFCVKVVAIAFSRSAIFTSGDSLLLQLDTEPADRQLGL